MMWTYWLGIAFVVCLARANDITVSQFNCGNTVHLGSDGSATLTYMGSPIGKDTCEYTYEVDDYTKEICVDQMGFDLPCNVKVKYNGGFYANYYPDKTFTCHNPQTETWCTSSSSAHIGFETESGSRGGGRTELRIYTKDSFATDIVENTFRAVIVTIAVVAAVIVGIIIVVIVVACYCCKRRRSQAGTVYRSPQQAAATTGSYPVVQTTTTPAAYPYQTQPQAGYQPPQQPQGYGAGYQPPQPQGYGAGYQPPQPQGYGAGYQPPPPQGYQADYQPPPPQAYGPGYQPPTSQPPAPPTITEKPIQASAPPASEYPMKGMDQPPPYPGI